MLRALCLFAVLAAATVTGLAQSRTQTDADCGDQRRWNRDRAVYCETREETFRGGNLVDIDAARNGGIRVRGWDRSDVRVLARIRVYADSNEQARRLSGDIRLETGARVRASGPSTGRDEHWSVSFDVDVPQDARLSLNTRNGGISIADFRGTATFRAANGGVSLTDVNGDIRGATINGGLSISLTGDRWNGAGLDVETTNGGVRMRVPDKYSAELETSTVNGRVRVDFPVLVNGTIGRDIRTTLGSGGARLRAVTRNGGITVERR